MLTVRLDILIHVVKRSHKKGHKNAKGGSSDVNEHFKYQTTRVIHLDKRASRVYYFCGTNFRKLSSETRVVSETNGTLGRLE